MFPDKKKYNDVCHEIVKMRSKKINEINGIIEDCVVEKTPHEIFLTESSCNNSPRNDELDQLFEETEE
jgi:hypothetical protein